MEPGTTGRALGYRTNSGPFFIEPGTTLGTAADLELGPASLLQHTQSSGRVAGPPSMLTERPPLKDVYHALLPHVGEWKTIGVLLGLTSETLDEIEVSCVYDDERLLEMIHKWLKELDASWENLINALKLVDEVNASTLLHTLKQPAFDQELDKAIAEGTVDFTGIDSVLVGVGGAGKTHTLRMITNQSAPEVRVSTPCTRPPVRLMISVENETMEMVGGKEFFGIIVDTAKEVGASLPSPHDMAKAVGSSTQLPSHHQRKTDLPEYIHKLEEEMHQHLSKKGKNKPKLLYKTRWYRLTDSGGQPQFLEVISIFIHNISVGIIVIKLNDRLDYSPMMEFYKEGQSVGEPYKSWYSQEHVVRSFMRALTSQAGEGKDVKFLFIGTHKDRMGECNESIEEKNDKLREIVHSFNMEANVIYNGANLIFAINAETPGDEDWDVMKQVKRGLVKCADVPSTPIPLRWFIMDLALQRFVLETKQAVLTESKCLELVANYHFDKASFKAGLEYLHQVKHILYYKKKRLVIADTQIIQNKLCEVVSFSIELRTNPNLCEPVGYNWLKLCKHGILHSSCLDKFPEGYIEGVFSPKDLLQLFTSLCIVSELGSNEYLMPCVLPAEETPCCNPDPKTQSVPAMVVEFPANVSMLGLFCGLVCYLMNSAKWKLAEHRGVPIHITRSSIHFNIPGYPGKITFNDPLSTFFTITFHGPLEYAPEVCPLVRETVLTGTEEVSKNLRYLPQDKAASYSKAQPKVTFLCPCKTTPLHPAAMSRNEKDLMHPSNTEIYEGVTDKHRMWLKAHVPTLGKLTSDSSTSGAFPASPPSLSDLTLLRWKDGEGKTCRLRLLRQISSEWWMTGLRLGLNAAELANIKQKTDDNEQRLTLIFTQWIDNDGHPPQYPLSWDGVCELLYDLDRDKAAEELKQALQRQYI